MIPIMMPPEGPPPPNAPSAPARVRAAVEFLALLSAKTSTKAAVGSVSVEIIPGQSLVVHEINAQKAACDLLAAYFAGDLRPNHWEKRRPRPKSNVPESPGIMLHCPACLPDHNVPDCRICQGNGSILAFSVPKGG